MFCHSMTLNLSNILRYCFKSKCWHLDFKCSIDFLGFICLIYFITAVDWPWLIAQLLQPTSQLEFPGSWVENSCLSLARQVWHGENLVYYQFKREMLRNEGTTIQSPFPPKKHRGNGGYSQSVIVPFNYFLLRLFPLLHHGPSSWAAVLFYSNERTARLQLSLGLMYLLQGGILHGL